MSTEKTCQPLSLKARPTLPVPQKSSKRMGMSFRDRGALLSYRQRLRVQSSFLSPFDNTLAEKSLQSRTSTPAAERLTTWSYTRKAWIIFASPRFLKFRVSMDPLRVLIPV